VNNILLPFLKTYNRVFKINSYFKIREYEFKVVGLSSKNNGIFTDNTLIYCNQTYSKKAKIKRVLLLTLKKNNILDEEYLIEEMKNYNARIVIKKNDLVKINDNEYFVRNCEPESGIIDQQTNINIENDDVFEITDVKIAVIKVIKFFFLNI